MTESPWTKHAFEASITRTCFSSTAFDAGWDGDPRFNIDGAVLQQDPEMRRLLELETAIRPAKVWAQKVARQIELFPPCGWCFPQVVQAVCTNIGAGDAAAVLPCGCYNVGSRRLDLIAGYACCLDGWLKAVSPERIGAVLRGRSLGDRDWLAIARGVHKALGEMGDRNALLIRRLLARLRFWLRAPYGHVKTDDNPRLGYLYDHGMGRHGGWDYFSFENHDRDVADLNERIRAAFKHSDRWITLIECTWPCAPKVARYIERIVSAVGVAEDRLDATPDELAEHQRGKGFLHTEGTYLDTELSRKLFHTSLSVLSDYVSGSVAAPPDCSDSSIDSEFGDSLVSLLGDASPEKTWLAALLTKRIKLFADSFKSYHFTRSSEQVV